MAKDCRESVNIFDTYWQSGSIGGTGVDLSDSEKLRSGFSSVEPNTEYIISLEGEQPREIWVHYYKRNEISTSAFISRVQASLLSNVAIFTTPESAYFVRFRLTYNKTVSSNVITKSQLQLGNIATEFEPPGEICSYTKDISGMTGQLTGGVTSTGLFSSVLPIFAFIIVIIGFVLGYNVLKRVIFGAEKGEGDF